MTEEKAPRRFDAKAGIDRLKAKKRELLDYKKKVLLKVEKIDEDIATIDRTMIELRDQLSALVNDGPPAADVPMTASAGASETPGDRMALAVERVKAAEAGDLPPVTAGPGPVIAVPGESEETEPAVDHSQPVTRGQFARIKI